MQSQRIRRTIRNRHKLDEGTTDLGNWHIRKDGLEYEVWHYNTRMLEFNDVIETTITYTSTGRGSATDQQGVNAILDELGVDLYFSRKGGSHYVTRDHKDVPSYYRKVMAT